MRSTYPSFLAFMPKKVTPAKTNVPVVPRNTFMPWLNMSVCVGGWMREEEGGG